MFMVGGIFGGVFMVGCILGGRLKKSSCFSSVINVMECALFFKSL